MKSYRFILLLFYIAGVVLGHGAAQAQKARPASIARSGTGAKALDTVKLRYRFNPGDKISYRAISYDSIMIYDTTWRTLARERAEMITFRCDSVVPQGYIMTVTTTDYAATERLDTLPSITRTTHDWVGRATTFLMSPTGRRIDFIGGPDKPSNAPGGPFEPLLLPNLGDEVGWIGQSGEFKNEEWLVDNIYPPIRWKGTAFRSIPARKDTMGQKTVSVGIAEVGVIAYQAPGVKGGPTTKATVNGSGDYYFSPRLGAIVGGGYDLIIRFTLQFPGGRSVDGRHIMSMYYSRVKENGR